MKTRDRILQTALHLFNEEGEPNITTVDLSNELNISPGNLYYHFKGKDQLIAELFDQFESNMQAILVAPIDKPLSVKDNWYYLYVVLEEIYHFRFFYDNLTDLLHRYPKINKKFCRLLSLKEATTQSMLLELTKKDQLFANVPEIERLSNSITLTITYWFNYQRIKNASQKNEKNIIHHGVYQIMSQLAPYLGENQRFFYEKCQYLYEQVLSEEAHSD